MGHAALNILVENKFNTAWASATPIRFENVAFTPPTTAWVSLVVKESDSAKITLGTAPQLRRTLGTVFIEVFTPLGTGANAARGYVDTIKSIFRDFRLSGFSSYEGSVFVKGETYYPGSGSTDPATAQWYQCVVSIPFKYDESL